MASPISFTIEQPILNDGSRDGIDMRGHMLLLVIRHLADQIVASRARQQALKLRFDP
jgi:hypothetical protein